MKKLIIAVMFVGLLVPNVGFASTKAVSPDVQALQARAAVLETLSKDLSRQIAELNKQVKLLVRLGNSNQTTSMADKNSKKLGAAQPTAFTVEAAQGKGDKVADSKDRQPDEKGYEKTTDKSYIYFTVTQGADITQAHVVLDDGSGKPGGWYENEVHGNAVVYQSQTLKKGTYSWSFTGIHKDGTQETTTGEIKIK